MKYSIYRLSDGVIVDHKESDEAHIQQNIPDGCGHIIGHHDYRSLRVDVESKELVPYARPKEIEQHERRMNALREIHELERRTLRYVGEHIAGVIDEEGKKRLIEIRNQITEKRKIFQSSSGK
jgi:hypothetical protein